MIPYSASEVAYCSLLLTLVLLPSLLLRVIPWPPALSTRRLSPFLPTLLPLLTPDSTPSPTPSPLPSLHTLPSPPPPPHPALPPPFRPRRRAPGFVTEPAAPNPFRHLLRREDFAPASSLPYPSYPTPASTARSYKRALRSYSSAHSPPRTRLRSPSPPSAMSLWSSFSSSSSWSSRDITQYLEGYPTQRDNPALNDNLRFYSNQIPSRPDGALIERIHAEWWGDYRRLEVHHGYIQWLFPLREEGMNSQIHPLQPHEITAMLASPTCLARLRRSYELILDFWGLEVSDEGVGAVRVVCEARLGNLIHSTHNYLRVTRVLKCLGELGMEEWKLGFGLRLWGVAQTTKGGGRMKRSSEDYWLSVMKDEGDRAVVEEVKEGAWDGQDEEVYMRLLRRRRKEREGTAEGAGEEEKASVKGTEEEWKSEEREKRKTEKELPSDDAIKRRKGNEMDGEEVKREEADGGVAESGESGNVGRAMSLVEEEAGGQEVPAGEQAEREAVMEEGASKQPQVEGKQEL